jgi:thiamine kinase-like enzyme
MARELFNKRNKSLTDFNGDEWVLNDSLHDILGKAFNQSTWLNLQNYLNESKSPFTLCHGDFHCANMIWCYKIHKENHDLVWFDWTEIGIWESMTEIGQLMISDIKPEVRRCHESSLLRLYWSKLVECGVNSKDFTFDDCLAIYKRRPVEKWLWVFPLLYKLKVPAKGMLYFQKQILEFISDHKIDDYDYTIKMF